MSKMSKSVVVAFGVFALTGCASQLLSDDRLVANTAGVLGVTPSDLSISDRRTELTNTYYVARVRGGATYACTINGGNALSLGMVNPPFCTAQAVGGTGRTYGRRGFQN